MQPPSCLLAENRDRLLLSQSVVRTIVHGGKNETQVPARSFYRSPIHVLTCISS